CFLCCVFFFSSRRRHTRSKRDWSSDVCSSDLFVILVYTVQRLPLKTRHNQVLLHHNALSSFYVHSFSLDRRVLFFHGMRHLPPGLYYANRPASDASLLLEFSLMQNYLYLV